MSEAKAFADRVGYPVLVRPSYVLSGAAMAVIKSESELSEKLEAASSVVSSFLSSCWLTKPLFVLGGEFRFY